MKYISLNGVWTLWHNKIGECSTKDYNKQDGQGQGIPCEVPGAVHSALINAEVIKEPLFDKNYTECTWIYENEWWHERDFVLDEEDILDVTEIVFDGLDLTADIYVNNILVGKSDNAFISHTFDISYAVKAGRNTVAVKLDEGSAAVRDKDASLMAYSWDNGNPHRVWMRKPQFCYGWDWTVIFPTLGIWRGVHIASYKEAAIDDVFIRTDFLGKEPVKADKVTLDIKTDLRKFALGTYKLTVSVSGDKRYHNDFFITQEYSISPNESGISVRIDIDSPRLWWPNDLGEQHLYDIEVALSNESGVMLDTQLTQFGIRSVSIDQSAITEINEAWGNKPSSGESLTDEKTFTFTVNGVKIFSKGACWVPCDCIPGRITNEKYKALLDGAKEMHFNMLRVWGGGYYESDSFYDYCDKNGIMVWQDFMFACGYYPDFDDSFCETVRDEALSVVTRLRNHPCLFGWSGNNEIYTMYARYQQSYSESRPIPFYGKKIYEEILPGICVNYDPDRPYRPASPYPDLNSEGDQHSWEFSLIKEFPNFLNIWLYAEQNYKYLSEFGVLSPMNVESIFKSMSPEYASPGNPIWKIHSNTRDYVEDMVEKFFGKQENFDLQRYTMMGQAVQAEGLKFCYEAFRRKRFYTSGVLLWMYTDSFGTSGWTFIDYFLNKKALYYYTKKAFAPLCITYKGYVPDIHENMDSYSKYYQSGNVKPLDVYAINELLDDKHLTCVTTVYTSDGNTIHSQYSNARVKGNEVLKIDCIDVAALAEKCPPEKLIITSKLLSDGVSHSENRYFLVPMNNVDLRGVTVNVSLADGKLTLLCDKFVWFTHIATPDGATVSDNDFDLLPGVRKVLEVSGLTNENLKVYSLNKGEVRIIMNDCI